MQLPKTLTIFSHTVEDLTLFQMRFSFVNADECCFKYFAFVNALAASLTPTRLNVCEPHLTCDDNAVFI